MPHNSPAQLPMDFLFERMAWLAGQTPDDAPGRAQIFTQCERQARRGKTLEETGAILIDVARALRALGRMGADCYCYIVGWVAEHLAEPEIARIYGQEFAPHFTVIERAYKLRPNWEFRAGEEPPEYLTLSHQFESRVAEITAAKLRELGEPVLAEMYDRDRAGFQAIRNTGRISLLGSGRERESGDFPA